MRQKNISITIAAAALLTTLAVRPLAAQRPPDRRPVQIYINLGYVNLFSYPKWVNLGPELELRLGRVVSVNPEVAVWFRQSAGGTVRVVPGATVNFRINRLSIGAGAVGRVADWELSAGGYLIPKVQASYIAGPARLSLYGLYLSTTKDVVAGLTISMGIGRRYREPED